MASHGSDSGPCFVDSRLLRRESSQYDGALRGILRAAMERDVTNIVCPVIIVRNELYFMRRDASTRASLPNAAPIVHSVGAAYCVSSNQQKGDQGSLSQPSVRSATAPLLNGTTPLAPPVALALSPPSPQSNRNASQEDQTEKDGEVPDAAHAKPIHQPYDPTHASASRRLSDSDTGGATTHCLFPIVYANPVAVELLDYNHVNELIGRDFGNAFRCYRSNDSGSSAASAVPESPLVVSTSISATTGSPSGQTMSETANTCLSVSTNNSSFPVQFLQIPPPPLDNASANLIEVLNISDLFAPTLERLMTLYSIVNGAYYGVFGYSCCHVELPDVAAAPSQGVTPFTSGLAHGGVHSGLRRASDVKSYGDTDWSRNQCCEGPGYERAYMLLFFLQTLSHRPTAGPTPALPADERVRTRKQRHRSGEGGAMAVKRHVDASRSWLSRSDSGAAEDGRVVPVRAAPPAARIGTEGYTPFSSNEGFRSSGSPPLHQDSEGKAGCTTSITVGDEHGPHSGNSMGSFGGSTPVGSIRKEGALGRHSQMSSGAPFITSYSPFRDNLPKPTHTGEGMGPDDSIAALPYPFYRHGSGICESQPFAGAGAPASVSPMGRFNGGDRRKTLGGLSGIGALSTSAGGPTLLRTRSTLFQASMSQIGNVSFPFVHMSTMRGHVVDTLTTEKLRIRLNALKGVDAVVLSEQLPPTFMMNVLPFFTIINEIIRQQRHLGHTLANCFVSVDAKATIIVVDIIPTKHLGSKTSAELQGTMSLLQRLHHLHGVATSEVSEVEPAPVLWKQPDAPIHNPLSSTGQPPSHHQQQQQHCNALRKVSVSTQRRHSGMPSVVLHRTVDETAEGSPAAVTTPNTSSRNSEVGMNKPGSPLGIIGGGPQAASGQSTQESSQRWSETATVPPDTEIHFLSASMTEYLLACDAALRMFSEGDACLQFPIITPERCAMLDDVGSVQLSKLQGISLFGVSVANALTADAATAAELPSPEIISLQYDTAAEGFSDILHRKNVIVRPLSPPKVSAKDEGSALGTAKPAVDAQPRTESVTAVAQGEVTTTSAVGAAIAASTGEAVATTSEGKHPAEERQQQQQQQQRHSVGQGAMTLPLGLSGTSSPPSASVCFAVHPADASDHVDAGRGAVPSQHPLAMSAWGSSEQSTVVTLPVVLFHSHSSLSKPPPGHSKKPAPGADSAQSHTRAAAAAAATADEGSAVALQANCPQSPTAPQLPLDTSDTKGSSLFNATHNTPLTQVQQLSCTVSTTTASSKVTALFGGFQLPTSATAALSNYSTVLKKSASEEYLSEQLDARDLGDSEAAKESSHNTFMSNCCHPSTFVSNPFSRSDGSVLAIANNDSFADSCNTFFAAGPANETFEAFKNNNSGDLSPAAQLNSIFRKSLHVLIYNVEERPDMEEMLARYGHCTTFVTNPMKMQRYLSANVIAFDIIIVEWSPALITPMIKDFLLQRSVDGNVVIFHVTTESGNQNNNSFAMSSYDIPEEAVVRSNDISSIVLDKPTLEQLREYIRYRRLMREMSDVRAKQNYQIVRQIGSGAFGDVYEVMMFASKGSLAMKRIFLKGMTGRQLELIYREVTIMSALDHPNVITFSHTRMENTSYCIFMELGDGTLKELLHSPGVAATWSQRAGADGASAPPPAIGAALFSMTSAPTTGGSGPTASNTLPPNGNAPRVTPEEAVLIIHDIANGLAYLHGEGIAHRDIKPENILFSSGAAKLADFGSAARVVDERQVLTNMKGTFSYMSPEVAIGEPYGKPCDMWSLGCVIADVIGLRLGHLTGLHLPAVIEMYRSIPTDSSLPITATVESTSTLESHHYPDKTRSVLEAVQYAAQLANHERGGSVTGHRDTSRGSTSPAPDSHVSVALGGSRARSYSHEGSPVSVPPAARHPESPLAPSSRRAPHVSYQLTKAEESRAPVEGAVDVPPITVSTEANCSTCDSPSSAPPGERSVVCIHHSRSATTDRSILTLPSSLVELLEGLLHRDPNRRMTVEELLEHQVAWDVEWMAEAMAAVRRLNSICKGISYLEKDRNNSLTLSHGSGTSGEHLRSQGNSRFTDSEMSLSMNSGVL